MLCRFSTEAEIAFQLSGRLLVENSSDQQRKFPKHQPPFLSPSQRQELNCKWNWNWIGEKIQQKRTANKWTKPRFVTLRSCSLESEGIPIQTTLCTGNCLTHWTPLVATASGGHGYVQFGWDHFHGLVSLVNAAMINENVMWDAINDS